MEEFPGNAHRRREPAPNQERPKVERVTQSPVTRRKKGFGRKFAENFMGGEPRSVGEFVFGDVLIPALRDMIADGVRTAVEMMVYPQGRRSGGFRSGNILGSTPNYHRMGGSRFGSTPDPRAPISQRARANHDFQEIVFSARVEADEVLERLFDLIQRYESATVRDLYEMVGIAASFTDEKYGWTDIRDADVRPIRGGYLLDLPRPELLR